MVKSPLKPDNRLFAPLEKVEIKRSTRTIFMDNGYVVEDESPDILFTNPKNERTRTFLTRYMESGVKKGA